MKGILLIFAVGILFGALSIAIFYRNPIVSIALAGVCVYALYKIAKMTETI